MTEARSRKRMLFVAFHFPPLLGSTGILRTVAFARNLAAADWDVCILTAGVRAYPEVASSDAADIEGVRIVRAAALDAQRHLSIFGRYPRILAVPDRWQSWIPTAVACGLSLVRQTRPDVLVSTYPIASAHVIGLTLARLTGIPWVADFRDPMAQENYPPEPKLRRLYWKLDESIFMHAARVVVTTDGTADLYRQRYPQHDPTKIAVIPNGFDEDMFARANADAAPLPSTKSSKLTLLHSGLLDPRDRNPSAFFHAIAELRDEGLITADTAQVVLRASRHERDYAPMLHTLRLNDLVKMLPPISYVEALREIAASDACLLFQASNCNRQIPAKVYEYLYAERPVIALTDPSGDTARLLRSLGLTSIADINSAKEIKRLLSGVIAQLRSDTAYVPSREKVMRYSRRSSSADLDRLLRDLIARKDPQK